MKYLFLLLFPFLLFSCSGKSLLHEIPNAEFTKFSYHRAGNMSSLHIEARNAKMDNNEIVIESVTVQADYGPFVNFNIRLEGYKRIRAPED
jgi:hypothetical protein